MRRRTTDVKSDEDSTDRLETRRARRVMTRESPPRASRCPRPTAVGRTRGGRLPTGRDSNRALHAATTRTRQSKPPVSPSDDGPYIQKNHMGVCIVHYGTHDRTRAIYIVRADPRERRRDGDDRRVRSRPPFDSTTDDDRRVVVATRERQKRARRDSRARTRRLERATEKPAREGRIDRDRIDRIAREFDRIESVVDGRARWRDARR